MSKFELKLPKMGESVAEATITSWLKEIGDEIDTDEAVLEIATDKVDTEVPCEFKGVLLEKCFQVGEVVQVGQTIAIIEVINNDSLEISENNINDELANNDLEQSIIEDNKIINEEIYLNVEKSNTFTDNKFLSPLVKNIIKKESLSENDLNSITGSGKNNRITKNDILKFLNTKKVSSVKDEMNDSMLIENKSDLISGDDQIIEMTRMGKIISKHMMDSIKISAHVQSFIEIDVTNLCIWRNKIKNDFEIREGEKLTFTPIFMEAVAIALRAFPLMNISVKEDQIILKKNINIGMATSLSDGNLIVPVIKNADRLNLVGMTKTVNDLAHRSRNNKLNPEDVQDGTYTVTNVGIFGSIMGTPIINQPQVGILALGAIRKVPAVIETSEGDFIGIRQRMFVSHSYDHRVVNGALGSKFIKAIKDHLESWDLNREI